MNESLHLHNQNAPYLLIELRKTIAVIRKH